ncbi:unnamed protein product [Euphydryas editha]|uniref:Transposase n=1 Tax=Euphydryas editha TaxID=104508 RepID=A0AAU9U4X1_EUPED|nr:unnamed protein product [Euphydryas editha]
MPRGKHLNETEINIIKKLHSENYSMVKIAKIINRSHRVVRNFLKDPENYGKKKRTGRPKATTPRERRSILRVASNSALTARQIAAEAGVSTNLRNVQRIIHDCEYLERKKLQRKPPLSDKHKLVRLQFAKDHVQWKKKWRKVIFTDEKKFNLDGPDGFNYYFHGLRKENSILSRRQAGGGSVIIWSGIGYSGKMDIKFCTGKINSKRYIEVINEQITSHATRIAGNNFIFQQDNASVHRAQVVKDYFAEKNIQILEWPAYSPDLNIIENCWGDLSRAVYRGSRQFITVEDLKKAIINEWQNMNQDIIKNLYDSLPNRMIEVISKSGGSTKY